MSDTDTILIQTDTGSDLRFKGHEIAHVSSEKPDGPSSIRWTELTLYKTDSGKYVVQRVGVSLADGENDKTAAYVCDDHEAIKKVLAYGWLSKLLYDQAGIDIIEDI